MEGLLILVGLAGFLFGLVNLVRPLGRLRIETRMQAGLVVGASVVVMIVGGAFLPLVDDADPTPAASGTTLPSSPSTTVLTLTPSVAAGSTTTPGPVPASTTSLPASSSTTTGDKTLALDILLTIPIELETPAGYDRDLFPHWSDADGDGCDTREEVLIRDAGGSAEVGGSCGVTSGAWYSVYDGVWLDHAVTRITLIRSAQRTGSSVFCVVVPLTY
jgi:hypothetical protein